MRPARRDWILLPLLGFATIAVISLSAELIARRNFSESATSLENCLVVTDPATGVRGIPNSVCREKSRESPLVEFRLDNGGYRSGTPSGPKAPGSYRIVLIGSSIAMGERVPFDQTLAALLPKKLSQESGRKVELYNQGMAYGFARSTAARFQDALAADPDMVLWVLTPLDVERAEFDYTKNTLNRIAAPERKLDAAKTAVLDGIRKHGGDIVTGFALRYWLYEIQSQSQYVRSYFLNRPDEGQSGFLRRDLNPQWQAHLREFAAYAADIAKRARSAGIPLVATLAPNRPLAAMISLGEWPSGYDPYELDKELHSIIAERGGIYIDILPGFREIPGAERLFYPIDGHPDGRGQAVLADLLAEKLAAGAFPELTARNRPTTESNQRE
jgi:hypothetical protein